MREEDRRKGNSSSAHALTGFLPLCVVGLGVCVGGGGKVRVRVPRVRAEQEGASRSFEFQWNELD